MLRRKFLSSDSILVNVGDEKLQIDEECNDMESKTKLLGHAIHPMLIVFPLGLLATSFIFDIIYLLTNSAQWTVVAFYMIGAGVIGGLIAAIPGFLDWMAIPRGTRAKNIGLVHGLGNVVIVVLFSVNWLIRRDAPEAPESVAIILSFLGIVLALLTGWLGGELVDRLAVGVDPGAHLNAPNSLSGRPASENVMKTQEARDKRTTPTAP
jgi:uncharacterized membrane protein